MAKVTLAQLGDLLKEKRGERGLREVSKEIGISAATLSRVEGGNLPDLATFGKICRWLQLNPAELLGVQGDRPPSGRHEATPIMATAHFRAKQTTSRELAAALSELILTAQRLIETEAMQENSG